MQHLWQQSRFAVIDEDRLAIGNPVFVDLSLDAGLHLLRCQPAASHDPLDAHPCRSGHMPYFVNQSVKTGSVE